MIKVDRYGIPNRSDGTYARHMPVVFDPANEVHRSVIVCGVTPLAVPSADFSYGKYS